MATETARGEVAARARPSAVTAGAFLTSRVLVAAVAMFAVLAFRAGTFPAELGTLHPFAGWPASGLLDWVFSPLARWDAGHYLQIAKDGYDRGPDGLPGPRAAFFPLFPLLTRAVAEPFGASAGALLIAGTAVSLAAFAASLALLRRLVARELGPDLARRSVWLLALWPGSVFFSAPYSESVFLLCTLGAFVAAREGRWALAGIACALASSSRLIGLVVVVPVALMYLYGPRADAEPGAARGMRPRFPLRRDAGWLALAPLGLVAFSAYLAQRVGDPLAWSYAQTRYWKRVDDAPPLVLWRALKEAWHSLGTLRGTLDGHVPTGAAYQIGNALALTSLLELGVLALALVAAVGCLRRLPLPYGAYVLVSLVVILGSRVDDSGTVVLQAMHRYVAVLFPVFVWLALATAKRDRWTPVLAAFGTGLGLLTAQFAASYWLN